MECVAVPVPLFKLLQVESKWSEGNEYSTPARKVIFLRPVHLDRCWKAAMRIRAHESSFTFVVDKIVTL